MQGDEVITQSLTFVATANAISHAGGIPVFVDVDMDTMGLSPKSLATFLEKNTVQNPQNECINVDTGRRIAAVLPMHTFGFCTHIEEIAAICAKHNIPLVEDAAESLGSYYKGKHTGRFGKVGTFSFNGNKTITCGGGGAIITDDDEIGKLAKHLSTTAKKAHAWEFAHDMIAYNYRMPNLNAALACAQLEQLPKFLENKRELADLYTDFFENSDITFVRERPNTTANYWLNTILMPDAAAKEVLLEFTNKNGVMTRPIWQLMNRLPMYENCQKTDTPNAEWLEARVVNIPSSFRP
jgi:aminotransferase in exopolysaccharide biosynthesis